ncbi:radical S-adenosyl methionine domain-containing protein 1, mitochondrial-like [Pollicipes pollicipes]|uniref:radical S-adenosyl methionine domain-containing protein 1, mitochondrial-like n=1 Tax=Pollicipes pollicipes TaxID=41117 RepID=UPI0018850657|nr:radical S-adenosyl methionine domain-containing protein 1, mitochondrial-like [Pollicipes pollicipes]
MPALPAGCTYCDFNKYVSAEVDHERMKRCLVAELRRQLDSSYIERVTSVFFGGGTPSMALPSTVEAVVSSLRSRLTPGAEVTLEANPTSATCDALEAFRQAGVNRLSLGVQDRWRHLRGHAELRRLSTLLEVSDERLAPTERGMDVLDALLPDLLNALESRDEQVTEDLGRTSVALSGEAARGLCDLSPPPVTRQTGLESL